MKRPPARSRRLDCPHSRSLSRQDRAPVRGEGGEDSADAPLIVASQHSCQPTAVSSEGHTCCARCASLHCPYSYCSATPTSAVQQHFRIGAYAE
eukprot:4009032-Pleurochrysis_carterae.AAC.2